MSNDQSADKNKLDDTDTMEDETTPQKKMTENLKKMAVERAP